MSEKEKIKIDETLEVVSEIKTLVGKMFKEIGSYDDAVAVRTALEAMLKVLPVVGKKYRSVKVAGVIVEIVEEGVLFERSYYTKETYKDVIVSKEEK